MSLQRHLKTQYAILGDPYRGINAPGDVLRGANWGEAMKIFSAEKCLKAPVIFALGDEIPKEQVMAVLKYLRTCHSKNINALVDSKGVSRMNECAVSGIKCRFAVRPCVSGIKTEREGFMQLFQVMNLLIPLHTAQL